MKKLYLIRHAKSSWKDYHLDDFDRPLNKRGLRDSLFMGTVLKQKKIVPDAIYSSPALRAKSTIKNITKEMGYDGDVIYDEDIYDSTLETLQEIAASLSDEYETVFLVGHNPAFNMLAEGLVRLYENIPTCGIVEIEFECESWRDISAKNARLVSFDYPKKHL